MISKVNGVIAEVKVKAELQRLLAFDAAFAVDTLPEDLSVGC